MRKISITEYDRLSQVAGVSKVNVLTDGVNSKEVLVIGGVLFCK